MPVVSWEYKRCPRATCHSLPILWGGTVQWKWLQEWRCECEWQWGSHLLLTLLTPFPLPPHHCHCKPQRQRIYFLYIFFMTDCILTECWLFLWSLCDVFKTCIPPFHQLPALESDHLCCSVASRWGDIFTQLQSDTLENGGVRHFTRGEWLCNICKRCYWQTHPRHGLLSTLHWQEKDWISVCDSCPTLQQCKSVLWSLHCDLFVVNFAPRLLIVHWRPVRQ